MKPLNEDRDAVRWAREFNAVWTKSGVDPIDEGWLTSWFANAMMCGEDTYRWRMEAAQSATQDSDMAKDATRYRFWRANTVRTMAGMKARRDPLVEAMPELLEHSREESDIDAAIDAALSSGSESKGQG